MVKKVSPGSTLAIWSKSAEAISKNSSSVMAAVAVMPDGKKL